MGVDLVQHLLHLLPGLEDIGLPLGVKGMVPVSGAFRGLYRKGTGEGQSKVVAHVGSVDEGPRVVDAVLLTQGVKTVLMDQPFHLLQGHIGSHHILRILPQIGRDGGEIIIPAAQQQNGLARELGGNMPGMFQHLFGGGVVLADPVVNDGASVAGPRGIQPIGDGPDPIGLVKGPGHGIDIDIRPQKQGDKGLVTEFHNGKASCALVFSSGLFWRRGDLAGVLILSLSSPDIPPGSDPVYS